MYHMKISNIIVFDIELLKSLEHILLKGNICLDKKKLSSLSKYLVIFYHVSNALFPPFM